MLHKKHEIQASKCCKSFPCRIQVSTLLCTLKNKMFERRAFVLFKQRFFVVMVMVSMRLREEPNGENYYSKELIT